jgi:hypothetical protein
MTRLFVFILVLSGITSDLSQGTLLSNPYQFSVSTSLIDFEVFPDGSQVPYVSGDLSDQWQSLGVLISDSGPAHAASAYAGTQGTSPHSGTRGIAPALSAGEGASLLLSFLAPGDSSLAVVPQAGLWIQNGSGGSSLVTFYDRSNNPIRVLTTLGTDFFAGLRYDAGISAIRITDPTYFMADDLQFGPITPVPEPSIWTLVWMGIAAVVTARRRRSRIDE